MRDDLKIVQFLLDSDDEVEEFRVWLYEALPDGKNDVWAFEVPDGRLNFKNVPNDLIGSQQLTIVETRMRLLVATRNYPSGSYFNTPWGLYLIHGKNIGKI